MESFFDQAADHLVGLLPKGHEKAILEEGGEALRPYLKGSPSEVLLNPDNGRLLSSVMAVAATKV